MKLDYIKADPSGNTTVFILSPVPRRLYGNIAGVVMSSSYLAAEQISYVEEAPGSPGGLRMEMMGGEFCGNASRSFAALLALYDRHTGCFRNFAPLEMSIDIDVSGINGILQVGLCRGASPYTCTASLSMPLPQSLTAGNSSELGDYSIATFPGINHVILWERKPNRDYVEKARRFILESGLSADAFGVMFYETAENRMTPAVYVADTDSLVWESSCGSGSAAVAAAMAYREGRSVDMLLDQPGGNLSVRAEFTSGKVCRIILSGKIRFTSWGSLFIDDSIIYHTR